ncbi:hypothetical protein PG990_011018 [Apiospora arundinis]
MSDRYHVGWYRFVPFMGYHHILMMFTIMAVILWCESASDSHAFLLAGCTTSNGLRNVYLLSLSYSNQPLGEVAGPLVSDPQAIKLLADHVQGSSGPIREIRVGYFSLCAVSSSGIWLCSDSTEGLVAQVRASGNSDPLNLLGLAHSVRTDIVFCPLLTVLIGNRTMAVVSLFIAMLLLATFPGWHEDDDSDASAREIKPFPSRPVSKVALALLFVASLLGFATVFWQHIGSAGSAVIIENMSYHLATAHVGNLAMALGWVGVFFASLSMVGLHVMIKAIQVLTIMAE